MWCPCLAAVEETLPSDHERHQRGFATRSVVAKRDVPICLTNSLGLGHERELGLGARAIALVIGVATAVALAMLLAPQLGAARAGSLCHAARTGRLDRRQRLAARLGS